MLKQKSPLNKCRRCLEARSSSGPKVNTSQFLNKCQIPGVGVALQYTQHTRECGQSSMRSIERSRVLVTCNKSFFNVSEQQRQLKSPKILRLVQPVCSTCAWWLWRVFLQILVSMKGWSSLEAGSPVPGRKQKSGLLFEHI